jgi:hypothetical protein
VTQKCDHACEAQRFFASTPCQQNLKLTFYDLLLFRHTGYWLLAEKGGGATCRDVYFPF